MYKRYQFDVINVPFPIKGMNQQVSADILPFDSAFWLENIIPDPLGEGRVRYGCEKVDGIDLPFDSKIVRSFYHPNTNKWLLYTQVYKIDTTVSNKAVIAHNSISFKSNNATRFIKGETVKIIYTKNGTHTLITEIKGASVTGNDVVLTFEDNILPLPFNNPLLTLESIWHESGSLYVFDGANAQLLKENLSTHKTPRAVYFKGALVLCNGVDPLMQFDGSALSDIVDFVLEKSASAYARESSRTFTCTVDGAFIKEKYQNTTLQVHIDGVIHVLETSAISLNATKATITVTSDLPTWDGKNRVEVYYADKPPAFDFLCVAHNRLWGFRQADPMSVYYTFRPESLTNWFNETTKQVPYIDISYKHGTSDQLKYIGVHQDKMVFMGAQQTQLWSGHDPSNINDFTWSMTLNGGAISGDLCLAILNDLLFISPYGVMRLSRLNTAQQFALTSEGALDPLVRAWGQNLSLQEVRNTHAFFYQKAGFAGFKIGSNPTLMYHLPTGGWSIFSGIFERASSFMTTPTALFLCKGNAMYRYGDGMPLLYQDDGGAITFKWTLPKASFKGKRFAGKRYHVEMDYPSTFMLAQGNHFNLSIYGDMRETFNLLRQEKGTFRGDTLGTVPLSDDELDTSLGTRLDAPYPPLTGRASFVSASFWISLEGQTNTGPLSIKSLQLFGRKER